MSEQLKIYCRFLKENKVYHSFFYNKKLYNPKVYFGYDYTPIDCAFSWASTKEGCAFWRLLSDKWKELNNHISWSQKQK